MTKKILFLSGILIADICTSTVAQTASDAKKTQTKTEAKAAAQTPEDPGQKVFEAQCSRCHNAPEQLNPRLTGTVARHMRVRANLSEADERTIMRFFNP